MALPPTAAPAPAPGAAPEMAGGAPPDAMGAADDEAGEGTEPPVLFTVLAPSPAGPYQLVAGDEPEGEGAMAADAPSFQTPQELMKAIMALLNPDKGAEDAFAGGFKGGKGEAAAPGM